MGLQSVIFDDFSGGLDTSDPVSVSRTAAKFSPNCNNATVPDGGKMISQRAPHTEYNFTPFPNKAVRNVFNWRFTNAGVEVQKTYWSVDGKIYASDRNQSAPALIFTGTGNTVWTFTPVVDVTDTDRLMLLNGVDAPQIITSSSPTVVGAIGGTTPQGKVAKVWKNFAIIVGTPGSTRRLFFSAIGNPLSWTTASDFIDIRSSDQDDTDPIVDLCIANDNLFVFKKNSVWRVTKGPPSPEVVRVANVGTPNPRCIAVLSNTIYFWGGHPVGIWSLDTRTDTLVNPAKFESAHINAFLAGSAYSGGHPAESGLAGVNNLALFSNVFACTWGRRVYFAIQQDPADDSGGVLLLEMLPDAKYKLSRNDPDRIPIYPHGDTPINPNSMCPITDPITGEEILLAGSWGRAPCRLFDVTSPDDADRYKLAGVYNLQKIRFNWDFTWASLTPEEKYERLRRVNVLSSGHFRVLVYNDISNPTVPFLEAPVASSASDFNLKRIRPDSRGRYHKISITRDYVDPLPQKCSIKSVELMVRGMKEH